MFRVLLSVLSTDRFVTRVIAPSPFQALSTPLLSSSTPFLISYQTSACTSISKWSSAAQLAFLDLMTLIQ